MVELEDSVGYTINRDLTNTTLDISQPGLITKMAQGFNEYMKSLMTFNTPATPYKGIVYIQEKDIQITYNIHKIYRSSVGSLLYLLKHSRPK